MSLFELFQRFTSNTHNPQLDESRRKHDQLPKTEYGKGERLTKSEIDRDKKTTFQRGKELGASDLIQIFLGFSEEALLDEYQFGADVDKWVKYLLRETLKSRQRFARERQKQNDALRFSPDIYKVIEREKNQQNIDQ